MILKGPRIFLKLSKELGETNSYYCPLHSGDLVVANLAGMESCYERDVRPLWIALNFMSDSTHYFCLHPK